MNFEIKELNGANPLEKRDNEVPDMEKIKKDARARGEYIVTVSGDEKGLTAIARKFNMSLTDFKNMTGLTKDTLDKNQVIKNIPHAQIPDGKGLKYLAEQNERGRITCTERSSKKLQTFKRRTFLCVS